VGRYDSEDERGVHMLDVGVHDAAAASATKEEYVRKAIKFGIRPEFRNVIVPSQEIARITRLGEFSS
jgi:hypothetical protein